MDEVKQYISTTAAERDRNIPFSEIRGASAKRGSATTWTALRSLFPADVLSSRSA